MMFQPTEKVLELRRKLDKARGKIEEKKLRELLIKELKNDPRRAWARNNGFCC